MTRLALAVALLGCSALPVVDVRADAGPTPCEAGARCDGACRDLARDPSHCGACGRACGEDQVCDEGVCAPIIVQLSAGNEHTCARSTRGDAWCWGRNETGQASTAGESVGALRPARIADVPPLRWVSAGDAHSCGITEADGEVWCWGDNRNGGCDVASSEPTCRRAVRLPEVRDAGVMCAGGFASCVTVEGGAVRCWGSNNWGGLGDGREGRGQPSVVELDGITHLGCGWGHVCARRDDGSVWCWGSNTNGQLGHNRPGPITAVWTRPVLVSDLEDAAGIVAAGDSNCAWNAAGVVRCWGGNDVGLIGDGTFGTRWAPVTADLPAGVAEMWSGRVNLFARSRDGALLGWGASAEGNLGGEIAVSLTRPAPVFAALSASVREVSSGRGHTCVRLEGGRVRCLGDGRFGQLGDGRSGVRAPGFGRPSWPTE